MSESQPLVLRSMRERVHCPVCGKRSYSATGMHPQCAIARADALTRDDRKKAALAEKARRKSWTKTCPKCQHEIPTRRVVCDCGEKFELAPFGAGMQ